MKILYYSWNEWMRDDCLEALQSLGHEVVLCPETASNFDLDTPFFEKTLLFLKEGFDAVFSMNYLPVLSRLAKETGILYLSWISDCPNLTLYSKTVPEPQNRIFAFDIGQVLALKKRGAHAYYLPLPVNTSRLDRQLKETTDLNYEVSFLGSFYQDDNNYLDRAEGIPEELRGYMDGLAEAQLLIYGYDLIAECFGAKEAALMMKAAPVFLGESYDADPAEIYRDWIRKKVTILERERLLKRIGEGFSLAVATDQKPEGIRSVDLGYLNYYQEMPVLFRESRINLNLTLRCIQNGIPLRVVDVLGAGGFLLSNFQPDFLNYFVNGRELVWFQDAEELSTLISYYLSHEEERARIARNGHAAAVRYFSYERLLTELFHQVEEA